MFNLFKKKDNSRLKVIISIDYKDHIDIQYIYNKQDSDKANKMATLLYCLNNKLLMKNFLESLLNNEDKLFVTEVINYWGSFDNLINEPIIQPLNAFSKNVK